MINIDHVIPDILNLFLRITDVLFNLLILEIRRHGEIKRTTASEVSQSNYHDQLEFFINNCCKIPFKFSVDKETKQLKWRDLMGPEKRVLFKKLHYLNVFRI